jgi:chloramphenicol-sensitive protein RarD
VNPTPTAEDLRQRRIGVLYGLAAYGWWGFIALYFKALLHVGPVEILAHRVWWSVLLLVGILAWQGRLRRTWRDLDDRRTLAALSATTLLITVNWLVFIYAVATERLLEASLGYFINPLVNILLGRLFLHERLNGRQRLAVVFALVGVTFLAIRVGSVPWIALVLAVSFALYGLVRKTMTLGPVQGLAAETAILSPFAVGYLVWMGMRSQGAFLAGSLSDNILLPAGGVISVLPLIWFINSARRLRYATIGFLQFLAPTLQFLLAVFAFREPFSSVQLAGFACIWSGLALYAWDAAVRSRRAPPPVTAFAGPPGNA